MRRFRISILLVAFLWSSTTHAALELVNGISAVVNDSAVTFMEVQTFSKRALEAAARRSRTQADFDGESLKITKAALEQLIDRRLIVQEYKSTGGAISESAVDDILKKQIKREFGDPITFSKMLRQAGRTYESYRKEEVDMLIFGLMVRNKIAQEIVISPKRIERLYNQDQEKYRVGERAKFRMIVVEASRHARGEPRKIAEQVLVKARAGEDFAKLANEFSDDARITKGGDRGWIEDKETSLAKELKAAVFSLQAGQVSDVIELGGTAFVIKVEERKPAQIKPITEVRIAIEKQLRDQERDRLQTAWLKRLRKKAFIAYF
jgi:peptidyl-prolyl cis-trans isomerase SurA